MAIILTSDSFLQLIPFIQEGPNEREAVRIVASVGCSLSVSNGHRTFRDRAQSMLLQPVIPDHPTGSLTLLAISETQELIAFHPRF